MSKKMIDADTTLACFRGYVGSVRRKLYHKRV